MDVGERLQSIRKLKGLSQRELAKRAGVTNSTISMIEKNSVSPSISSLRKVLGGIPMSMVEFFSEEILQDQPTQIVYKANELIEGLTLFFSIIEMVLLVTPARLASSRWERPLSLRMDCSRSPTSNAGAS